MYNKNKNYAPKTVRFFMKRQNAKSAKIAK